MPRDHEREQIFGLLQSLHEAEVNLMYEKHNLRCTDLCGIYTDDNGVFEIDDPEDLEYALYRAQKRVAEAEKYVYLIKGRLKWQK